MRHPRSSTNAAAQRYPVLYKFQEGFTNAVRRPVQLADIAWPASEHLASPRRRKAHGRIRRRIPDVLNHQRDRFGRGAVGIVQVGLLPGDQHRERD